MDGTDSCAGGGPAPEICWFCKKGRHGDCMAEIPSAAAGSEGPHDCSFDTRMVACGCGCGCGNG